MADFDVLYCPEVDPELVMQRLIRNPNYGGKGCNVPGTCVIPLIERDIKPKFFEALEANVKRDGFRNPILLYATDQGLLLSFGGSRLRVAKRLGIKIPAIVVWYGDELNCWSTDTVTPDNYHIFFTDVPELFEFTDYGIDTHYSLERNRREFYDPKGMAWTEQADDTTFLSKEFPWIELPKVKRVPIPR